MGVVNVAILDIVFPIKALEDSKGGKLGNGPSS